MESNRTVFAQLLDYFPKRQFRRFVLRHGGDHNTRSFSCWDQFLCMAFAQLTGRESLRDIEICLRSVNCKLYPLGLRGKISRSTLSDANERRSSTIFGDVCHLLIKQARKLYSKERFLKELDAVIYALDSSYLPLCISLCPWAKVYKGEAYIKLHTLLDLRGAIPSFIAISSGKINDFMMLDRIIIEPGAFYVMDKGYFDFARLFNINQAKGFFIIRAKKHVVFSRVSYTSVDKITGLRFDRIVRTASKTGQRKYPELLRLIRYYDAIINKRFTFLTNNFLLDPLTICNLYKERWQVELFFRWIKQHLRIKNFYGTSQNAIETQVWIAISIYLLVAIIKKELRIQTPMYQILQFLSLSLFEEIPILQALSHPVPHKLVSQSSNQLQLF